jgi:PAS domain S-box-containing protein
MRRKYRIVRPAIAEDTTDRHDVDEQLRRSERLLAEAQRLSHIGSWTWNVRASTVTWSEELFRIFGVPADGINPATDFMAFVHPDDVERVKETLRGTFNTKAPFSVFYRIRRHSGEQRFLHSRGLLLSNERGDAVSLFGTTQDVTERMQVEEALRRSERLLRLVLNAIPVGVAVMDPAGDILLNNPASVRIWSDVIPSGVHRYSRTRAWWHKTGKPIEADDWASVRARVEGETSINEIIDIEAFDGTRKIIQNSAVPIHDERNAIAGAVVINEDVTDRMATARELENSARQMRVLATRLMHAQDDERRRIARMLHETTAQDLAGLKMMLGRLSRASSQLAESDRALLTESLDLVNRSMRSTRTLSYLLHPPLLDEAGLLSALRWYTEGFAERSGIKIELNLPPVFDRLPQDVEMTLFRVVQEALINIHRHADSPTATVTLEVDGDELTLQIRDEGRGMPADLVARLTGTGGALGVGVVGMRERLKQLDGTLDIKSDRQGTTVRATIPVLFTGP